MRPALPFALAAAIAILCALPAVADDGRLDALVARLEKAVERAEAAAARLEALSQSGGGYDPTVTAKAGEAPPDAIAPDAVLAALKSQLQCLGDCRGTKVAITRFEGVEFGAWRHPTPGEVAYSIGIFDNWVMPATVRFQMRRYYADQTVIQDCVWSIKLWYGEAGKVTHHGVGLNDGDTTVETKGGPEAPPPG